MKIRKIVINDCFGGFGLSQKTVDLLKLEDSHDWIERDDPGLVKVVEALGKRANSRCAKLRIVEIPADVEWQIEDHKGIEYIAEKHRTWQ